MGKLIIFRHAMEMSNKQKAHKKCAAFSSVSNAICYTFLASFSAFKRSFSSFFRFSAEYSFRLFSLTIFSLILLAESLDVDCSVLAALLPFVKEMMKNGLRDVDGVVWFGFSVGEAITRVLGGFGLIGATLAVMPNFDTVDCVVGVDVAAASRGTVSRDDVDDADLDFCDVYEANLQWIAIAIHRTSSGWL